MTPAASHTGTAFRKRCASCGVHASGSKSSPQWTNARSHALCLAALIDGEEQRQERLAVCRCARLPHRLSERHVLHLGPRRHALGVRRQKGEGPLFVALVLGEVKADATDEVPHFTARAQERLHAPLPVAQLGGEGFLDGLPQRLEQRGRYILRARHRRR